MKTALLNILTQTLTGLYRSGVFSTDLLAKGITPQLTHTRDKQFGDVTCNIALLSAKLLQQNPREIAERIVEALPPLPMVKKIEIAGPGFINFYMMDDLSTQIIGQILSQGSEYGKSSYGSLERVHIEYVSANPTGPLHVGHGRGAAYGATLANILKACGFSVHSEYYVNDAGRQMDILAASVWCRYNEYCGESFPFPDNAYQGDYVKDIAKALFAKTGSHFQRKTEDVLAALSSVDKTDKDTYIDALITYLKTALGDEHYRELHQTGLNTLQNDIKDDLAQFGVTFDKWFSERSLADEGKIEKSLQDLQKTGYTYEQAGALWFKSTAFGDDKDRVLIRDNGQPTYFASDVAYQLDKYQRGFTKLINVFGADHHGYVPRLRAFLTALGKDTDESFFAPLVQFAILWRGDEKVSMSTRSGEYVTLRELRNEVGNDATRFFYVMRKHEQHMDFDLTLAKSESNDNPVYYIQYAHARICSVKRQLAEKGLHHNVENGLAHVNLLSLQNEKDLMDSLGRFPELIILGAKNFETHGIPHYLRELASLFHTYYNSQQFLVDETALRDARLCLVNAIQVVLQNGLSLLGVSAPDSM